MHLPGAMCNQFRADFEKFYVSHRSKAAGGEPRKSRCKEIAPAIAPVSCHQLPAIATVTERVPPLPPTPATQLSTLYGLLSRSPGAPASETESDILGQ